MKSFPFMEVEHVIKIFDYQILTEPLPYTMSSVGG